MTEKPGRKALFMEVPEKEPDTDDSFARDQIRGIHALFEDALEGDFSGRLSVRGPDNDWRRLADSINSLFSRIEEFGTLSTLYKKIFEQQTAPFILKDAAGEVLLSNPAYEDLDQAAERPLEKEGVGSESMVSFVAKTGNPHSREIVITQRNGTERIFEEISTPLSDNKGIFAVLFTLHDVSGHKNRKGEPAVLPEDFPATFIKSPFFEDNLLPGLVVDSGMKVVAFNDEFLSMSGMASQDLLHVDYHSLPILESKGQDVSYILERNTGGSAELTIDFPGGPRIIRQYGVPVTDSRGDVEAALFFVDITNEREEISYLENQVQELQYLLSLPEEKGAVEEPEPKRDALPEGEEKAGTSPVAEIAASSGPLDEKRAEEKQEVAGTVETAVTGRTENSPGPEESEIPVIPFTNQEQTGPEIKTAGTVPSSATEKEEPISSGVEKGSSQNAKKEAAAPGLIHDVIEFALGSENYALDIEYAKEIVEMMPITPIPRAPHYLKGVLNLRGEITNILDINQVLGVSETDEIAGKKIIVLSSDACGGEHLGIIVDEVHSVLQINEKDIEQIGDGISDMSEYIKGIIQVSGKGLIEKKEETREEKSLIILIDIQKVLFDLLGEACQK